MINIIIYTFMASSGIWHARRIVLGLGACFIVNSRRSISIERGRAPEYYFSESPPCFESVESFIVPVEATSIAHFDGKYRRRREALDAASHLRECTTLRRRHGACPSWYRLPTMPTVPAVRRAGNGNAFSCHDCFTVAIRDEH